MSYLIELPMSVIQFYRFYYEEFRAVDEIHGRCYRYYFYRESSVNNCEEGGVLMKFSK